jgi:hypothetical protein
MLSIPFALLRDQLYPKFPGVVKAAIAEYPVEQQPVAYLPDTAGYNSHGHYGIIAVQDARARLRALHDAAIGATGAGAGIKPANSFPVPYPRASDKMYPQGEVPGYNTNITPFHPQSGISPLTQRMRQIYEQCPWLLSPGGGRKNPTVIDPEALIASMQAARNNAFDLNGPTTITLQGLGWTPRTSAKFTPPQREQFRRVGASTYKRGGSTFAVPFNPK